MVFNLSRHFQPSVIATVTLLALAVLFSRLGLWQTQRAGQKTQLEEQFQSATSMPLETAIVGNARFAEVDAVGRYDTNRHVLLDNQVWKGQAGVHVFTPFQTKEGLTVLVNRGWLPLGSDRNKLPDIPTPVNEITLNGMLNLPPKPGRALGQADKLVTNQWPQLVTYLDIQDVSEALQTPLITRIVQLSDSEPAGFDGRQWKPVFIGPDRHRAYAFQWFALAGACIALWLFNGIRRSKGSEQ